MQPLYTAKETADVLRISPRQVRRYANDGSLPSVRYGRAFRFLPEVIERVRREGIGAARSGRPRNKDFE